MSSEPKPLSKLRGRALARRVMMAEVLGPCRARVPLQPRTLDIPPSDAPAAEDEPPKKEA